MASMARVGSDERHSDHRLIFWHAESINFLPLDCLSWHEPESWEIRTTTLLETEFGRVRGSATHSPVRRRARARIDTRVDRTPRATGRERPRGAARGVVGEVLERNSKLGSLGRAFFPRYERDRLGARVAHDRRPAHR